ncbi:MAG: tripartite tricarboxylate transporter TctB family protein [Woeseiaceae bacterium]|nr:tripartite tricarboxylate transporter TctB family protein [Woeseiaceae bacterium]
MSNERVGGLLFLTLSILYGLGALAIPTLPIDEFEAMNARSLPFALSGIGILLSLVLIFRRPAAAVDGELRAHRAGEWRTVLALIVVSIVYALLLDWLGFVISTALFLAAGLVILGERRRQVVFLLPIVLVALLWLLLVFVLEVYLAPGRLFTLLGG